MKRKETITIGDISDSVQTKNVVSLIATNHVYCSKADYDAWRTVGKYIRPLGTHANFCYTFEVSEFAKPGTLLMNQHQRMDVYLSKGEVVPYELISSSPEATLLSLAVDFKVKKARTAPVLLNSGDFTNEVLASFANQPFSLGQKIQVKFDGVVYICTIQSLADFNTLIEEYGIINSKTVVELSSKCSELSFVGRETANSRAVDSYRSPLKDVPLQDLGVGGLDDAFLDIFRRAFSSRCLNPETAEKWGVPHTKGLLLYGPPGTGKTLMAKTIAKMLNSSNCTKITGSDILSKWVGEAERQLRELFQPAEDEWARKGIYSSLHVIIIDELDCICKQRASSQSSSGDSIVNQLLGKMEGLEDVWNFLVIGMTNRRDLIDSALLRPGRFEVQIEIGLPDEEGRLQILKIHAKNLMENDKLHNEISLEELAKKTKNFSGAELGGLVRAANSYALCRSLKRENDQYSIDEEEVKVTSRDFEGSFNDVIPAFGINRQQFQDFLPQFGFVEFNSQFQEVVKKGKLLIQQFFQSPLLRLSGLLVTGVSGSGKSAYASHLALDSQVTHVKFVTAEEFIGKSDDLVTTKIASIFNDCYKAPSTVLIIDGLERIISYSPVGHRFSNAVLQALLFFCTKQPPIGRKLFIIATSAASVDSLEVLGVTNIFSQRLAIPSVKEGKTIKVVIEEIEYLRQSLSATEFSRTLLDEYGAAFKPIIETTTSVNISTKSTKSTKSKK